MTEQEFRKLKPLDLIQILLAQGNEVTAQHEDLERKTWELERLLEENEIIKAKLNDRDAMLEVIKQGLNEGDERIRDLEEEMKKLYSDRRIELEDAGSLVQAALELNKIFEAAQMEAEQYIHGAGQRIEGARFEAVCMAEEDEEPVQSGEVMAEEVIAEEAEYEAAEELEQAEEAIAEEAEHEAAEEPEQAEEVIAEAVEYEAAADGCVEADSVTDDIIIEEKPLEQELPKEPEEANESLSEEKTEEVREVPFEEKTEETSEALSEEEVEESEEMSSENKVEEIQSTELTTESAEAESLQNGEPMSDEACQVKGPAEPKAQKAPAAKRKSVFGIFGKHKK